MLLKEKIKQFKYSDNPFKKQIFYVLKPCWIILKLLTDARLRSEFLGKLKNNKQHYQISTFTKSNRYPLLFEQAKLYLQNIASPKILSFGCSTGEEVTTLAEYMPNATLIGVDINQWCIKQCIKNNKLTNQQFYHRFSREFESLTGFDAIFCMAVFQRPENRLNINNQVAVGFSFETFEKEIEILDAKLKPGGLMIIDNADFSFQDTKIADGYTPLQFERNQLLRNRPLFGPNHQKIAEKTFLYRVFKKN